jgi:predicted glycosyltransferase
VDKEPLGLKKEILPTFSWLKKCCPNTRTVLGLRDITVSLLIPRETPRLEQTLRAQCFKERKLLDYIPWEELSNELFRKCKDLFRI